MKGKPSSWIIDECVRLGADIVAVGSRQAGFIRRSYIHIFRKLSVLHISFRLIIDFTWPIICST